jgi:tRNA-binding EMAP/Myf-like protein
MFKLYIYLLLHACKNPILMSTFRKASKHAEADTLYVEEIDIGEEKPRTVFV